VFLAADAGRLFGLDMQLLFGMVFQAVSILILFVALTYILYEPVRKILEDRKARIANDVASAKQDKAEAGEYKAEYEAKLKNIDKEADVILSEARKKALAKENEIIASAKAEAAGIVAHAKKEAELEMKKAKDEIKQQIIEVATVMAGKIVTVSLDDEDQANLIQETLKEMGEETWLS
jgi:F-type H+-transporting ATPase subunit b